MAAPGDPPADAAAASRLQKIFRERASFELHDEDVDALSRELAAATRLDAVPLTAEDAARRAAEEAATAEWTASYPNLLSRFDAFTAAAAGKRVAVFLDYDGTLTPIVRNPDAATLSPRARAAVRALACLFPTAIVSGRARDKVEAFVQLPELYYAGSHGMDIVGPREKWGDGGRAGDDGAAADGPSTAPPALAFRPAQDWAPVMDALHARLAAGVAPIPGATVEHNTFCVSVHYRNVCRTRWDDVAAIVSDAVAATPGVRASRGRKVLEVKPGIDWDKGAALAHLLDALGLGPGGGGGANDDVLPLYIGDDTTDEDAFGLLAKRGGRAVPPGQGGGGAPSTSSTLTDADRVRGGAGVLVASRPKPSAASYSLRDPGEVLVFLSRLAAWGASPASGWHAAGGCTGWRLRAADARVGELPAAGGGGGCASGGGPPSPSGSTGDGVSPAGRPPRPPADRRLPRPPSAAAASTPTPTTAAAASSPDRAASDATSAPAAAAAAAAAALGTAPR